MSIEATSALFVTLSSDAAVLANVGSHGGSPAVFSARVPEDSPDSFVYIGAPFSVEDASSKNGDLHSRYEHFLVTAAAVRSGSVVAVETLAAACKKALHRSTPAAIGAVAFEGVACAGGTRADTDHYFARQLSVRVLCRE